jgi:hypothetical protein
MLSETEPDSEAQRMTRDEADELAADLKRIGVRIEGIEPRPHYEGEWQLYCWCPDPPHFYFITNAQRFCQSVHDGLSGVLPRGALD